MAKVKSESIRQQNVDLIVNVDKELAQIIVNNIGVEQPTGSHVDVSDSYPSLSQANAPKSPYTQKVGVIIANGFNGFDDQEVNSVLKTLQEQVAFIEIVSETLQDVVGAKGIKLNVDKTFITTSPYLLDSLYIVGGTANNETTFNYYVNHFIQIAYEHYKPIGVATSAASYLQAQNIHTAPEIIFTENPDSSGDEFVAAVAEQRFWDRKVY